MRDTISAYLEREPDIGTRSASTMEEADRMVEQERPFDLVSLEYAMSGIAGLERLRRARWLNVGKPVAHISGAAGQDMAKAALAAGATGFVPNTMAEGSLVYAVRFMVSGKR